MEIVSPIEDLGNFAKVLKKHRYEVYGLEGNLVFQSNHRKPSTWFVYILFFIGVIRLVNQRVIQACISFALGIAGLIVLHFEKKKYEMTYTEIQNVAVSETGMALSFRDQHRQRIQLSREEIESLNVDISYDGNSALGYVTLRDIKGNIYTLFIIMHKHEDLVRKVTDDMVKYIKAKLVLD